MCSCDLELLTVYCDGNTLYLTNYVLVGNHLTLKQNSCYSEEKSRFFTSTYSSILLIRYDGNDKEHRLRRKQTGGDK